MFNNGRRDLLYIILLTVSFDFAEYVPTQVSFVESYSFLRFVGSLKKKVKMMKMAIITQWLYFYAQSHLFEFCKRKALVLTDQTHFLLNPAFQQCDFVALAPLGDDYKLTCCIKNKKKEDISLFDNV